MVHAYDAVLAGAWMDFADGRVQESAAALQRVMDNQEDFAWSTRGEERRLAGDDPVFTVALAEALIATADHSRSADLLRAAADGLAGDLGTPVGDGVWFIRLASKPSLPACPILPETGRKQRPTVANPGRVCWSASTRFLGSRTRGWPAAHCSRPVDRVRCLLAVAATMPLPLRVSVLDEAFKAVAVDNVVDGRALIQLLEATLPHSPRAIALGEAALQAATDPGYRARLLHLLAVGDEDAWAGLEVGRSYERQRVGTVAADGRGF